MEAEITAAIGPLIEHLDRLGAQFGGSAFSRESFGNFYLDCALGQITFRLFRDRGQYMIDGDTEQLKRFGLFRAFDSKDEFGAAILKYAKSIS